MTEKEEYEKKYGLKYGGGLGERVMDESPYYDEDGEYIHPIDNDEWMAKESKKAMIGIMIMIDKLSIVYEDNGIDFDTFYKTLQDYCKETIDELMDRFGYED